MGKDTKLRRFKEVLKFAWNEFVGDVLNKHESLEKNLTNNAVFSSTDAETNTWGGQKVNGENPKAGEKLWSMYKPSFYRGKRTIDQFVSENWWDEPTLKKAVLLKKAGCCVP